MCGHCGELYEPRRQTQRAVEVEDITTAQFKEYAKQHNLKYGMRQTLSQDGKYIIYSTLGSWTTLNVNIHHRNAIYHPEFIRGKKKKNQMIFCRKVRNKDYRGGGDEAEF